MYFLCVGHYLYFLCVGHYMYFLCVGHYMYFLCVGHYMYFLCVGHYMYFLCVGHYVYFLCVGHYMYFLCVGHYMYFLCVGHYVYFLCVGHYMYFLCVGHYVYIEASSPRRPGDKARLWTPPIAASNGRCLTLWYHMHGVTMGTLNIYAVQNTTRVVLGSPIWSRSGTQGKTWLQEYISLPNYPKMNVSKNTFIKFNILGLFITH